MQLVYICFRTGADEVENREAEASSNPHVLAMAVRMNRIKQRFKSLYQNSVGAKAEKKESFRDTLPPISSGEE
jgi:hypothetical protein